MATLTFNHVRAEQFKGFIDKEFDLFARTDVVGKNGSGKTTTGMALTLPFTGKDLSGRSNPEIHPDSMPESEPHVTVNGAIDGKPITIELIQKDTRTKKDREADKPPKIANKYKVNAVDTSATAFKKNLLERGIDLDKYEQLTNTNWFSGLKEADKRKAVFAMVGNITDLDVAESIKDKVTDLVKELPKYNLAEIEAMAKDQKRAAKARYDALPEQIIGAESTKVDVSHLPDLKAKKQRLSLTIEDLKQQNAVVPAVSMESIESSIMAVQQKKRLHVASLNESAHKAVRDAESKASDIAKQMDSMRFDVSSYESRLERKRNDLSYIAQELKEKLAEYGTLKTSEFPQSNTICPTCGQKLPEKNIAKAMERWKANKDTELAAKKEYGNKLAVRQKSVEAEIKADEQKIADLKVKVKDLLVAHTAANEELNKAKDVPVYSENDAPGLEEFNSQIADLEKKKASFADDERERAERLKKIDSLNAEILDIERELAKEDFNKRVEQQIKDLRKEQTDVAQNLADAENILHQVMVLNQQKNTMLTDAVNSHFPDFIRFRLFKFLKNGEIADCCEPEILNEFGEWKAYNTTANNSLKLRADIAILNAFQNFHDLHLPIVVDNAECLDSENKRRIQADTQLIFLSVKDDADLTVTEL